MPDVQWAQASQFNWAFDNLGGTPLQEAVAGNWSNAAAAVQEDGRVLIASPNPGGGQVFYVRGVWRRDTGFPWDGFWAEPLAGDPRNYYLGGSFSHQGACTALTLGTALPPGTEVQLYYIYLTGERAARYDPLNTYPCIRRACRSRDDYTYDFAVDRLLDLMVLLQVAGREQGRDYAALISFLWEAFKPREESLVPPLVHDSFERQQWDRGNCLMYRGATAGATFQDFQTELAAGAPGRVLQVRATLPTTGDAVWFGYGLDWSLEAEPFRSMDRVRFALKGQAASRRVHQLTKLGSGSATLVVLGDYTPQEQRRFVVQIQQAGEVGQATCRWSRDGGLTWVAQGLITGDRQHPLTLEAGLEIYWEPGSGPDFTAGDTWTFWGGDPGEHPRRLLVTLNGSGPEDADPWGPAHTYVHALPDRFPDLTDFEIPFSQFWRRENLVDDGDRVRATWGTWYAATHADASDLYLSDREETEVILGETFYTQRQVTWNLSPYVTAFGVWAGIDTNRLNSAGRAKVNFLIKPVVSGANSLTIRVKVKDARGSYFHRDVAVPVNTWQRVVVNLADLILESGQTPLTHPLQVVDIGIPSSPPSNGSFWLTDLKFDEHLTFAGASRLRLLEFKLEQQGLAEHEWWLDEVGLNLEAQDPYPYAPRLAISLTPYGQNPWRGPTPVHYAQPLGPYLVGALNLSQNYLNLLRDAQDDFHNRYGGLKGPIMPVHTRNDVENISLCGEEDFNRFSWWPRHRDFGQTGGFWHFNGALTDASGRGRTLAWQGGGSPAFTTGICQPGDTAVSLDGSHFLTLADTQALTVGTEDFTLEAVVKPGNLTGAGCILSKLDPGAGGFELFIDPAGRVRLRLQDQTGATDLAPVPELSLAPGAYHYVAVSVDRDGQVTFGVDGDLSQAAAVRPGSLANSQNFTVGRASANPEFFFHGQIDLLRVHQGRALSGIELQDREQIIRGRLNGSAYPEVGCALGQFWAFLRLAQYFYVTNDAAAWEILENWLAWLDACGAPEGGGWQFPFYFSEYGFAYGSYDPGAAAAVALGCLSIYLRNGSQAAAVWARRLLDDLRLNRWESEFGGYKSDYHHAWLNALVLQAFGLAVNGRAGQAHAFAALPEDRQHFDRLIAWVFKNSGDVKPNVLNADLMPFSYCEDLDLWDYAPNYLAMRQMGSLEAVVLMAGAALEYALAQGDWTWFQRLLRFILLDNLAVLSPSQIKTLTAACDQAGLKNLVRLRYADYDRDNARYAEARDQAAMDAWGEQAVDLDFRYGSPVVLENPETAAVLASRLLKRLSTPWELAQVETWLEGVRLELGDTVAVSSEFHGLSQAEFTVFGKETDLGRRAMHLDLRRPLNFSWSWAVDYSGAADQANAIDQPSIEDVNWEYRSFAG
jgi:hypothetical protein